jgi:hypothetical protein
LSFYIVQCNNKQIYQRSLQMKLQPIAVTCLVLLLHIYHLTYINTLSTTTSQFQNVISNLLIFLLLWSYYKCCTTNSFLTPNTTSNNLQPISNCTICRHSKPIRTHHCRKCNKCVLKMDHHCPWVGHCIGKKNYKYYVLFLSYTVLSLCDAVFASIQILYSSFQTKNYFLFSICIISITTIGQLLLMLAVGYLLVWHAMQLVHNCTTIEWYQAQKNSRQNSNKLAKFPWLKTFLKTSKYDKGNVANIKAVFGQSMLYWCVPIMNDELVRKNVTSSSKEKNIV